MTKIQLPGVLLVSLLLVSVAQGGFLQDIVSDTVGSVVDGIFGPTIDNAREGVEAALNEVFDQKITPLVREVEATLDRDLSRVEDDVNRTVAGVEAYITNMVQEVAKEAKEMINSTIDQIRDKLIVTLFDRADKLETKLFKDVSAILDKVLQIVDHVDCTMLTVENSMLDFLRGLLKEPFANPFEKCRKELAPRFPAVKFRWLAVSQMDTMQLFELRKCRLLRSLTPTTPIATIRTTYLELQEAAAKARCAAVAESGVGMPSDMAVYMTRELAQASYIYHLYDDMGHTPHVLTAPRSLRRASAGSCNTPVECYSFALAALQEDRKDIQEFKDLARATHDSLDSITKQLSQAQAPAGTITAFAGSTPPTGWFMCNGQTLLRAQYPALFAAIGETYGKGDGSSTFVLPDLAGRVVVGSGSGAGLTSRALGQTGGEETHTLSIAEMPSHTHGYTTSSGTMPQSGSDTQCWVGHSAATTAPAGGNQPHNNMPPFVTLSYIIKS